MKAKTDPEGKYDGAASVARNMTNGMLVALLVLNGDRGTGFSVQTLHPDLAKVLPDLLEQMAKNIREQQEQTQSPP